ncbi:hypothetical protein PoB_002286300 [Plakobranchus ocellatus]|uniref:Uncharacterized protein n=1 Tax=Plakobranchus ocellatus TaxID=259542 RepID=A0AAV3ZP50_9GAST|nr:hypothetical protein PoB_002286300 [Plakobranchus ocellatus]
MATKSLGFIKRLWHEKPDIAASMCIFFTGPIAVGWYSFVYDKDTYHKHRWAYTVIREEDANPTVKAKGAYN